METTQGQAKLSSCQARTLFRVGVVAMVLNVVASLALVAGLFWARIGHTAETSAPRAKKEPRIIYPERTDLDFEGAKIEGEVRNPGELYFQRRQEEKFGSLVQPRTNFRRAILRDLMQTR